ncbi:MAG: selenium-binding family protein [candidate division Zixibacteria bacterium]|nr:selenium-binding family protein [candidate division Zixibacteria bacterium]MCI0596052.1 selenium-binding family protein [candidate division Zixibacteria bacterium]
MASRRRALSITALAIASFLLVQCQKKAAVVSETEKHLLIWAGDQARQASDFLAVVNFDPASADYGKIVKTVPLPNPGDAGNEPHHVGVSANGKTLACGGLLSALKGQKEVFFFDVSNPTEPKFIAAADPPQSAITDEFYPLDNGGFLVTMMGGTQGHHPGRVAEFDSNMNLVTEHPKNPPDDGFNPHGISVRPELNLMVTSDFICPSTTLHAVPGELGLRGSIRVWDFQKRKIVKTITLPNPAGTIDVRLIPGDPQKRAFTAGMTDDQLYLIDTEAGAAKAVFDFGAIAKGGWPQLMRITADGRRLFISMNMAGKVAMFDIVDPENPKLLKTLDLGANSGPHYIALTRDEKRLVITDYFLNEDDAGKVHAEGDHKVHVAMVSENDLALDPKFSLDFNTAIAGGPARPHGVAFK